MVQAGVYSPGPAISASVRVIVAGVERPVESIEWAADTTGGLPDQVVSAGTSMRSRTGTIRWGQVEAVQVDPSHPLRKSDRWPPYEGDQVQIDAIVADVTWRRFSGRLGRTTGSLTDGTLASQITDMLGSDLSDLVTIDPMIGDGSHRMMAWGIVVRALEKARLGPSLPVADDSEGRTILHATLSGGLTPEVGKLLVPGTEAIVPHGGAWTGTQVAADPPAPKGGRDVLIVARGGAARSALIVSATDGTVVVLSTDGSGALILTVGGVTLGSWTIPVTDAPLLAMQWHGGGGISVWTAATQRVLTTGKLAVGVDVKAIRAEALLSVEIRHLHIGVDAKAMVTPLYRLPPKWDPSRMQGDPLRATRGIQNMPIRDVVDSWSEATLGSAWRDEYGVMTLRGRDRLVASPPVRTLRVDERIFAGTWSTGDDTIRSKVTVRGEDSLVQDYRESSVPLRAEVHQESSVRSILAAETLERFIEAPSEVEWGPIDTAVKIYGASAHDSLSLSSGSWAGAVLTAKDTSKDAADQFTEEWIQLAGGSYSCTVERLGHRTIKITEVIGAVPANRTADLMTKTTDTVIPPAFRKKSSPTIRAAWMSTWRGYAVTGSRRGPSWAPVLEHDCGWWLTSTDAQKIADALSVEVTRTMPTLSEVAVLWDPTRQIGDVETWIATDAEGRESWRADVLVSGYSESWDGNVPSQSVDVRVIRMVDPLEGKTYDDLAAAYGAYDQMTSTYDAVQAALPRRAG